MEVDVALSKAYIECAIDPEDVVDAMISDTEFSYDLLWIISVSLYQGLLLDNTVDSFRDDKESSEFFTKQLETLVNSIHSLHE